MRAFVLIVGLVVMLAAVEPAPAPAIQTIELDARDEWHDSMSSAAALAAKSMIVDADADHVEVVGPKKVRRVIAVDHGDHKNEEPLERHERDFYSPHHHLVISGVGSGKADRLEKRDLFSNLFRHKAVYKFGVDGDQDDDSDDSTDQ